MNVTRAIKKIETDSRFESVSETVDKICARLKDTSVVNNAVVGAVRSSLSEAMNNVVEHAYKKSPDGKIYIEVWLENNAVHMSIKDKGEKADATMFRKDKATSPDPESLPEGGWGLYLILSLMDEVSYTSDKKINHLKIVKFYK